MASDLGLHCLPMSYKKDARLIEASMRAKHFFVFYMKQQLNLGRIFGTSKMHLSSPGGLGCSPFKSVGSVVVDSLIIVAPIVCVGSVSWKYDYICA